MKKVILLFVFAVLVLFSCKKEAPAQENYGYIERCGMVLTCEEAVPLSHPPYYKMLVDFGSGHIEVKYWNRPFAKGSTFCYWQPI